MQGTHTYRPEAHDEHELIAALEPDQLVASTSQPLPRLQLGRGAAVALWALRIFVLLISVIVIYTFIQQLMRRS